MINYTWNFTKFVVLPNYNSLEKVVKTIHWEFIGKNEDDVYAKIEGSTDISEPDNIFVNFDNLTHAIVEEWIVNVIGEKRIAEFKLAIEEKIDEIVTPKKIILLPPWISTEQHKMTMQQLFISLGSTVPSGQQAFTTTGNTDFTVPAGVTSVSAVCVGGGGGGAGGEAGRNQGVSGGAGGGLAYGTLAVTPSESLRIVVGVGGTGGPTSVNGTAGGASQIIRNPGISQTVLLAGGGGGPGQQRSTAAVTGGTSTGTDRTGGGAGGNSGGNSLETGSGGGGAGGYSADGGAGGTTGAGSSSTGGGGGGGATNSGQGYGGGGVGLLGAGTNGTGGGFNVFGNGGSGGANGTRPNGGAYGGGGGACDDDTAGSGGSGGQGAVRIIWGTGRSYPSTGTADV